MPFLASEGCFWASSSLHEVGGQKKLCPCWTLMNFEQILWNKVFCRMFGLVVMEGMTLSGHPLIINKIGRFLNSNSKQIKKEFWIVMKNIFDFKFSNLPFDSSQIWWKIQFRFLQKIDTKIQPWFWFPITIPNFGRTLPKRSHFQGCLEGAF